MTHKPHFRTVIFQPKVNQRLSKSILYYIFFCLHINYPPKTGNHAIIVTCRNTYSRLVLAICIVLAMIKITENLPKFSNIFSQPHSSDIKNIENRILLGIYD